MITSIVQISIHCQRLTVICFSEAWREGFLLQVQEKFVASPDQVLEHIEFDECKLSFFLSTCTNNSYLSEFSISKGCSESNYLSLSTNQVLIDSLSSLYMRRRRKSNETTLILFLVFHRNIQVMDDN